MIDKILRLAVRAYRNKIRVFSLFGIPVYTSYMFLLASLYPIYKAEPEYIPVFLLALFVSVLIHELGHAFFVVRNKLAVDYIYISPIHGSCNYSYYEDVEPPPTIAYGGVLSQALAVSLWLGSFQLFNINEFSSDFSHLLKFSGYFIAINIGMVIFNLLPIPGLDGEQIWRHIVSKLKGAKNYTRSSSPATTKTKKKGLENTKGTKVVNIKRAK